MSYNSAFEAEMRRYQHDQITKPVACSLTPTQLNHAINQSANPKANRRRRTDDPQTTRKKRPLIFRKWVLIPLAATCTFMYFSHAGYFEALQNISTNVKASTGVDIFSAQTYKKLAQTPPQRAEGEEAAPLITGDVHREYSYSNTMDMHQIEGEARKLEEMAREFDRQFATPPATE